MLLTVGEKKNSTLVYYHSNEYLCISNISGYRCVFLNHLSNKPVQKFYPKNKMEYTVG